MLNLTRSTNRYVGALGFSVPPAPPSWKMVAGKPATSLGFVTTKPAMLTQYARLTARRPAPTVRPPSPAAATLAGPVDVITDTAKAVIGAADAKATKLENALTAILILSGIAAGTGVFNFLKR